MLSARPSVCFPVCHSTLPRSSICCQHRTGKRRKLKASLVLCHLLSPEKALAGSALQKSLSVTYAPDSRQSRNPALASLVWCFGSPASCAGSPLVSSDRKAVNRSTALGTLARWSCGTARFASLIRSSTCSLSQARPAGARC